MRDWIVRILFWCALAGIFLYFFFVGVSESDGYKKFRVETKESGIGFVVRMKPEGWEVWKVEHKVETSQLYPKKKPAA